MARSGPRDARPIVDDGGEREPSPWMKGLLVALLVVLFFNGLGLPALHEPDEGRYADVAASMARSGDWVTPRLDDLRYFEKPPLYFWLAGAAVYLLGQSELAPRIPSALACTLVAILLLVWGGRAFGRAAGVTAAAVFATTPLLFAISHMAMVDPTLSLLTTLALAAGHRGLIAPEPSEAPKRRCILGFWLFGGLATLTKGPIGLLIPLSAVGTCLLLLRRWRGVAALLRPDGLLVYLSVVAPWTLAMEQHNPGYLKIFLLEQNLGRFASGESFGRAKAVWFYVPVFLAAFFPWSALLPSIARRLREGGLSPKQRRDRLRLLLACAVVVPFGVFSVARSAIGYYLLPLCAPYALLAADALQRTGARPAAPVDLAAGRWWKVRGLYAAGWTLGIVALLLIVVALLSPETLGDAVVALSRREDPENRLILHAQAVAVHGALALIAIGIAVLAAFWCAAARALHVGGRLRATLLIAAGLVAVELIAPYAWAPIIGEHSARGPAELISAQRRPGDRILLYSHYLRGLPYYLREPVVLWKSTFSEFGHDIGAEEAKGRSLEASKAELAALLAGDARVLVLVDGARDIAELRAASPVPLEELGHVRKHRLFATSR